MKKPKIPFLSRPHTTPIKDGYQWEQFKVGTCTGLWCADPKGYIILAIENKKHGNGHFDMTMQWFEQSARRDHKPIIFFEVWNPIFKKHLIEKRQFYDIGNNNLIKNFI